jgi:hypothetical protein
MRPSNWPSDGRGSSSPDFRPHRNRESRSLGCAWCWRREPPRRGPIGAAVPGHRRPLLRAHTGRDADCWQHRPRRRGRADRRVSDSAPRASEVRCSSGAGTTEAAVRRGMARGAAVVKSVEIGSALPATSRAHHGREDSLCSMETAWSFTDQVAAPGSRATSTHRPGHSLAEARCGAAQAAVGCTSEHDLEGEPRANHRPSSAESEPAGVSRTTTAQHRSAGAALPGGVNGETEKRKQGDVNSLSVFRHQVYTPRGDVGSHLLGPPVSQKHSPPGFSSHRRVTPVCLALR